MNEKARSFFGSRLAISALLFFTACSEGGSSSEFHLGDSVEFKGKDGGTMLVDGNPRFVAAGVICIVEEIRKQESADRYAQWFDKINCGNAYGEGWVLEHRIKRQGTEDPNTGR